ncbi:MAG: cytochrome P450 [Rubricoccaceae bacterium]
MPALAPTAYRSVDYRSRYPGAILVDFTRNLLEGTQSIEDAGRKADADLVRVPLIGSRTLVWLRHPDLIRALLIDENDNVTKARGLRLAKAIFGEGLLTLELPEHTRRRKLVLPAFHHQRLRAYAEVMTERTADELATWTGGTPVDAAASMSRLTLAIASRTLFGTEVDRDRIAGAVAGALAAFDRSQHPFGELFAKLPTPNTRRARQARADIDVEVYRIIAEHRAAPDAHGDLLDLLLSARDEDTGEGLSDVELRDEVVTLLLAGHETTAVALAWTWGLLAQNPEAETQLHAEVDALDGPPTFSDVQRLPYTRSVFAEAMRLYPPAWAVGREAARDIELAGVPIAKGSTLLFGPLWLHSDPRFWSAPAAFDPDRFSPARKATRHKFAYLPFSAGRRGCIGEQFAWMEGVLVLATIAQQWRLRLASTMPTPHGSVTYRPSGPVQMVPERRF